jgi:hypothetical protein
MFVATIIEIKKTAMLCKGLRLPARKTKKSSKKE